MGTKLSTLTLLAFKMSKPYVVIQFFGIVTLVVSSPIFGSYVSFCNQTPIPKLCNSIVTRQHESRESIIKTSMSRTRKVLSHYLAMAQAKFSKTNDHGLIQLPEGGVTIQVNLVVAQDGSGDFSTINEAIQASINQRIGIDRFVIYVKTGIYKENVIITKFMTNLMLIGDGIDTTIITNDKNNHQGLPTHNTSTVQVWGSGFVAVGITFENAAGPEYEQAVALLSSSDLSVFYKCSFKGYQDTLSLLNYRQFLRECDIYGTVDFIFGDASAILQKCNIYVRTPLHGQQNTITAQGRSNPNSNTGFVIQNSRVAPDSTLIDGSVVTYLGRPWREFSRVVYVKCDFEISIDPAGWMPYPGNLDYDKLYYAECMNEGKGAVTDGRVNWPGYHVLTAGDDVEQFSVRNFFNGELWIPQTGVPFNSDI